MLLGFEGRVHKREEEEEEGGLDYNSLCTLQQYSKTIT